MADTEPLLARFEKVARPYLEFFSRNTCIEQSRILIEVLKRFGVEAEPLSVKLHIMCVEKKFQFFVSGDPKDHKRAQRDVKSFIRRTPRPGLETMTYHLVVLAERRILADLTLAQAEAPEFDLYLQPGLFTVPLPSPVPPDHFPDLTVEAETAQGAALTIRYIACDDRSFEKTPAWEPSHLWPLIDRIEKEMLGAI